MIIIVIYLQCSYKGKIYKTQQIGVKMAQKGKLAEKRKELIGKIASCLKKNPTKKVRDLAGEDVILDPMFVDRDRKGTVNKVLVVSIDNDKQAVMMPLSCIEMDQETLQTVMQVRH